MMKIKFAFCSNLAFSFQINMAEEATRTCIENYRDEDYQDNLLILGQDYQYFLGIKIISIDFTNDNLL